MRIESIAAVLWAVSAVEAGAQVTSIVIGKQIHFVQTSATDVALEGGFPYEFFVNVRAPGSLSPPPLVAGPALWDRLACCYSAPGAMFYSGFRGRWEITWFGSTQSYLAQTFPDGPYTVAVEGRNVTLNLGGEVYPDVPVVSFGADNGRWLDGKYVFDPTRPLTIYSGNYAGYGAHIWDRVRINFGSLAGEVAQFSSVVPGTNFTSYTLPANSLAPGQETTVRSQFALAAQLIPEAFPGSLNGTLYSTLTTVSLKADSPPQIFPMTVNANIGASVSSATASVQPPPQDVGTTGSIYVFAVAPATIVKNAASEKGAHLGMTAKGREKDVAVQCVLAQLTASGELKAVSTASLQAYVTGVLTGQAQAVTILNNVPTALIAGSVFYVGIGPDPLSMIRAGVNQRAFPVPASLACDPKPPQAGWWWNRAEGGRGYSIELAGNKLVFASYLYDATGRATWFLASGGASLDGSLFTGHELESYVRGQTLAGGYRAPTGTLTGPVTLAFNDSTHGTLIWAGGSIPIERFEITPGGLSSLQQGNQPQTGWWWNPDESGRGFFLEWQGGQLFMAGYMYDDAGNPIWYLSGNSTASSNLQSYSNNWLQFGNGQTLTGAYRAPMQVNGNVAAVTIQFSGAETGIMTLPNGRTTAIRRFRF